jgi:hypothetical protein
MRMSTQRITVPRIDIPKNVIRTIPKPVVNRVPPPVTRGISPPVINVPEAAIEYPEIDVPTEEEMRESMTNPKPKQESKPEPPPDRVRNLPVNPTPPATTTQPTIDVGGIEVPLPDPAPIIASGATAVVTTVVALGSTIVLTQVKQAADPLIKELISKRKKVKLKQVKPVLHFVMAEEGHVDIFEYSQNGTKMIDQVDDVERYLRDQVEMNSLYEYDNKVIIDDVIREKFTKEGAKRFKPLFAPAKSIAKKLASKFSI